MRFTFFQLLVAAAYMSAAWTAAAYPAVVNPARPNPAPALPAWCDPYTPPVTSQIPYAGTPAIAEWTHTGGPNDTLVATGSGFSTFTGASQGADTDFVVFGQTTSANPTTLSMPIGRLDGLKAAIQLGGTLPADSMYLMWAGNKNGYGAPVAINKTEAWWLGPEQATRGDTVSVYGQKLSRSTASPQAAVYVKPTGNSAGIWTTVAAVNPYKVDFVVPATLANGSYEVWIHNGHGGTYGWSGPLSLTVNSGPSWTGQEFNVTTFGVKGDGATDEGPALATAINYASARPGSTLFFPAGVYKITNYLTIPSRVRLRGAGRDLTTIRLSVVSATNPPLIVIYTAGNNIELRDMTLTATGTLPSDPNQYLFMVGSGDGSQDLRFTNLRLDARGSDTFDLVHARRSFFTNCEIIGHNGYLERAVQVFFAGCTFKQTNDADVPVWAYGGRDISMTGCKTMDLDSSNPASGAGWGLGRWFAGNGVFGTQRHVYLGENTSTDLGVRPGAANQNSGEQFLFEQNNYYFAGTVTAATSAGATLAGYRGNVDAFYPGQNDNAFDCDAIVVAGKGMGQHRAITSVDPVAGTIAISPPWNVIPDSSSRVAIMTTSEKVAIYRNSLDAKSYVYQQEPHIASSGVQAFEGALDFVVDGNTFHDIRTAIFLCGYSGTHENKPVYFGTYINNIVQNSRWGVRWETQSPATGVSFLGNTFRNNAFWNVLFDGFWIVADTAGTNPGAWVDLNVIERTNAVNLPVGITRTGRSGFMLNTLMLSNYFNRGGASVSGSTGVTFLPNEIPCLRGNVWNGFAQTYAGALPGPILESSHRITSVDARTSDPPKSGNLQIRNAGTGLLTWAATSNAAWLKVTSPTGGINGETATSPVTFTCNPQGLAAGTYIGYITVTASAQTKVSKVFFRVN